MADTPEDLGSALVPAGRVLPDPEEHDLREAVVLLPGEAEDLQVAEVLREDRGQAAVEAPVRQDEDEDAIRLQVAEGRLEEDEFESPRGFIGLRLGVVVVRRVQEDEAEGPVGDPDAPDVRVDDAGERPGRGLRTPPVELDAVALHGVEGRRDVAERRAISAARVDHADQAGRGGDQAPGDRRADGGWGGVIPELDLASKAHEATPSEDDPSPPWPYGRGAW